MKRLAPTLLSAALSALLLCALAAPARAADPCELEPQAKCFGVESLEASLSTTQAGAHPDVSFGFEIAEDPESEPNSFGLKDAYAPTRNVRIELPPGLIADPNLMGVPQQCTVAEIASVLQPGGGCPNGSQVGVVDIYGYELNTVFHEPVYMMVPPGGDVVARLGFIAGAAQTFVNVKVRSEGDYGVSAEIVDAPSLVKVVKAENTVWGIPADPSHDTERCTPKEVFTSGCKTSPSRPPGSRQLPFWTNPTRCGVPLELRVGAASWAEPQRFDTRSASFPQINGCNKLPFGPSLVIEPTNHRAAAPVGLDITARAPASDGVNVLEPAQVRDIRVRLPKGIGINASSGDGLETCSAEQAHFGERVAANCPDAAKMAVFEAEVAALSRRMKGAVYLREPEPGNPFRVWAIADDLGAHVKLQGQLVVDKQTGQIESVLLDTPQFPLREVKIVFKSGYRSPLVNPQSCGEYASSYEFTPWSGGPPVKALSPIQIDQGCDTGGFHPELSAGAIDPKGGRHSPFVFTLTREDGEQNPEVLDISLPTGLAATFTGIPRCGGADAATGACPAGSRVGKVVAAAGAGPTPLWVPQPDKRPTAFYLGGPYKGAPLSFVAVVPAQAGPFDFGNIVVRTAVYVDPETARATGKADPIPQIIEGIPLRTRSISVVLDRPGFVLNPTSCAQKQTEAAVTSSEGAVAHPSSPFGASDCAELGFKPRISFRLFGGTKRGSHPKLRTVLRPRAGHANIGAFSVALPHSEFLDQAHIKTVCTRVQFAADQCPAGSIYGEVKATTPLFEEPLSGHIYLRSSNNPLPDMVAVLKGPASLPVEVHAVGRIDSVNGGIRATFSEVPDAPITEVIASFPGGNKGLLENSTNLCARANKATAKFTGQNAKKATLRPLMQTSCGKGRARN